MVTALQVSQQALAGSPPAVGCCQGLRNLIGSIVDAVKRVFSALLSLILCRRREQPIAVTAPTTTSSVLPVVTNALPPPVQVPVDLAPLPTAQERQTIGAAGSGSLTTAVDTGIDRTGSDDPKYISIATAYAAIALFNSYKKMKPVFMEGIKRWIAVGSGNERLKAQIDRVCGPLPFSSENEEGVTFCSILTDLFELPAYPIKLFKIDEEKTQLQKNEFGFSGRIGSVLEELRRCVELSSQVVGMVLVGGTADHPSVLILMNRPSGRCGVLTITSPENLIWKESVSRDELLSSLDESIKATDYRVLLLGDKSNRLLNQANTN